MLQICNRLFGHQIWSEFSRNRNKVDNHRIKICIFSSRFQFKFHFNLHVMKYLHCSHVDPFSEMRFLHAPKGKKMIIRIQFGLSLSVKEKQGQEMSNRCVLMRCKILPLNAAIADWKKVIKVFALPLLGRNSDAKIALSGC